MKSENTKKPLGWRSTRAIVALASGMLVTACGGGNDEAPAPIDAIPEQFVGKTDIRYFGVDGDNAVTDGNYLIRFGETGAYQATITVVDGDTIILATNEDGVDTLVMNYDPERDRWVPVTQPFALYQMVDNGSDFVGFVLESGLPEGFAASGGFGLPTEILPTSDEADYLFSSNGFARVLMRDNAADPDDPNWDFTAAGDGIDSPVALTANFNAGTVSGTVFSGSSLVNFDEGVPDTGDFLDDDLLSLDIEMAGTISGATITGTSLTGLASIDIDNDGGAESVDLVFTNDALDGAFFGDPVGYLNGSWEADYELNDDLTTLSDGRAVGYFEAGPTD